MAKKQKKAAKPAKKAAHEGCEESGREAAPKKVVKLAPQEAGREGRTATACRSRRPSRSARPARRSTACASSTSPMCSRARPARSCSPIWARTCIKVERPGVGDITRGQLRDVQNADSLYFTMLNGNKRSITID